MRAFGTPQLETDVGAIPSIDSRNVSVIFSMDILVRLSGV